MTFTLTPRKKQIAEMVACGLTYDGIAFKLKLSKETVKYHMEQLNLMYGAHSQAHLIVLMLMHGSFTLNDLAPLVRPRMPRTQTDVTREQTATRQLRKDARNEH